MWTTARAAGRQVRRAIDRHREAVGESGTAHVLAPPPLVYLAAWGGARLLHRRASIPTGLRRSTRVALGGATLVIGAALSAAVVRAFRSAATPVSPLAPTTALVTSGPYRVTRNPDYVGQLLIYVGAAVLADTSWPIALLPAVWLTIDRGVVRRQERHLQSAFGSRYVDYAARVPRWL
jgi:protein-S-isoprenylcysteine O-methyltransferase Ste14